MTNFLQLIYAPDPIFKQKAQPVDIVDDDIRTTLDAMLNTIYIENGVGIGANMVGILKRLVVIDLQENKKRAPIFMINPEITWFSDNKQTFTEGSLSFPGISAEITRPDAVEVSYLDYDGVAQTLKAAKFLATVIQHEIDYLNGIVFLDHLSKLKRDMLLKKMLKHIKQHPPHVHSSSCSH